MFMYIYILSYLLYIMYIVSYDIYYSADYLVGGSMPTPLKHMSSSIGMIKFPTEWKNKTCSKPPTNWCL